jgi:predicted metal-binding membrane protein
MNGLGESNATRFESGAEMAEPVLADGQLARRQLRSSLVLVPAAVLAAAIVTWIVTVDRMRGMDAGPGTSLGDLGWFMGVWATMMAAMMLPSVMPTTLIFARVSAENQPRSRGFVLTWLFISGYLAAWSSYGLLAYGVFRAVRWAETPALSWHAQGPLIAGATIFASGLYQLSPLKRRCLRLCRFPRQCVAGGWRPEWASAVRMGFEHGAFCIGCCWGLMLILFALGVMSITWMLVIAGLIFAEKVLPSGELLPWMFAIAFMVVGIWVAAAPSSFPGLTQPGSAQARQAMRAMGMHGMNNGTGIRKTHTMGAEKSGSMKMK